MGSELMPTRSQIKRSATAIEKPIPAPVGGLNARDSLASMPGEDAVVLQNFYPTPSFVETRGGTDLHLDQFPGIIKTLAVYSGIDGANTLWAFSDQGVAEVTHGGRAPYLGDYPNYLSPTRTNGKHQWCMFGDGTHNWLIAVNGVDKPFYWNGTSYTLVDAVSTPALTGITSTDIVNLMVYKQRLFFIRNNKLAFDYLPVGVAEGAVSSYDLSPFASDGGYLMAMGVWTRDAGNGPDDYAVFITSEGQE